MLARCTWFTSLFLYRANAFVCSSSEILPLAQFAGLPGADLGFSRRRWTHRTVSTSIATIPIVTPTPKNINVTLWYPVGPASVSPATAANASFTSLGAGIISGCIVEDVVTNCICDDDDVGVDEGDNEDGGGVDDEDGSNEEGGGGDDDNDGSNEEEDGVGGSDVLDCAFVPLDVAVATEALERVEVVAMLGVVVEMVVRNSVSVVVVIVVVSVVLNCVVVVGVVLEYVEVVDVAVVLESVNVEVVCIVVTVDVTVVLDILVVVGAVVDVDVDAVVVVGIFVVVVAVIVVVLIHVDVALVADVVAVDGVLLDGGEDEKVDDGMPGQ